MSRAGLSDRLVQLSVTLCLIDVFPYALSEAEIINKEDEPQNVPGPPVSLHSWNVLGAVRAFLSKGVRNIIASNLAFCKETDALAKEQANEAKYEKVPLDEKNYKEVLPKVVVVPLPNLGPLSVEPRGYHSGPLSVEPRIPSGPLSVDPRGYHSGPLSTPSQHENKNKVLPQCEIEPKDLSLDEHKNKDLPQPEIKAKDLSLSKHKTKDLSPALGCASVCSAARAGGRGLRDRTAKWIACLKNESPIRGAERDERKTSRPGVTRIFKHLPPECQ